MSKEFYLRRCGVLDQLVAEGVGAVRRLCRVLGFPDSKTKALKSLSLLDLVVRACGRVEARALQLPEEAAVAFQAVEEENPPRRPLTGLFAVNDLRNLQSHFDKDARARVDAALERLDVAPGAGVASYGLILDHTVDHVTAEICAATRQASQALR